MDATEELGTAAGGGLVLGRYRLGRRLGSGGFGTVFAARDERLDRPVAVKAVPAHGPVPERAQREALAAARLDHPGIVAVFDAGEEGGERFLISELVEGRTLAALERDGALSDRDVLRAGLSLADALGHAHARGVIHRDVKPQNVIVPDDARPPARAAAKLLDFGVAHLAGDEPLTRTGDVVGTLAYMAPEQAAGERVDERADLYSLALVLYEGLSGTNPVRMPSPAATARRVGTVLPPLRKARRDLPAGLCAALDRALAPDPEARGTLADLAGALVAALHEVADEGGTIAPHPLEAADRRVGLLGRIVAGVAAGGLAAAAVAGADGHAAEAAMTPVLAASIVAPAVAALPRLAWLLAAAGAIAALASPWPDGAGLVVVGAVLPPLLLRHRGLLWSLPAVAPALGLAGLAGGYPAIAGQVRGLWARAALGACGACWLLLAEPLLGRDLFLGTAPGEAGDVLERLLSSGALVLALVWAAAAAVLPWLVRGRALAVDVVGATTWAAGLAAATGAVAESMALAEPRGLVAGALLAGALALIGARARDTVNAAHDRA
jgi:hypothetical protein